MNNQENERVLVIKISPVNGLNSSMLRTLALIKGLREKGYGVDMLTIRENANTVINDISRYGFLKDVNMIYANGNAAFNKAVAPGGSLKKRVVGVLKNAYYWFSIDGYTGSIAKRIRIGMLPVRDYKYLVSVSDPKTSHKVANSLIRQGLTYTKWIQYWGDPMANDITKRTIYPRFVYRLYEKILFADADSIVYTSPFTLLEQQKLYPRFADRMKYVPTAYIEEKNYPDTKNDRFTIGYYGAYKSYVRNIMPLYEACSGLDNVKLFIVGNSDIELESTDNITILPRGDIARYEEITDLYICIMNMSGAQIPGKAYHYAATNRPILVVLDGDRKPEFETFFQVFGRYEICDNTKEDIRRAIIRIMSSEHNQYAPYPGFSSSHVAELVIRDEAEG